MADEIKPLRIAVIGAGAMSMWSILPALHFAPVRLQAICDLDEERAKEAAIKFGTDRLVWTLPFVLYGIFRYLYLVHQRDEGGNPSLVLFTDRPLLAAVGLWTGAVIAIIYHFGEPG